MLIIVSCMSCEIKYWISFKCLILEWTLTNWWKYCYNLKMHWPMATKDNCEHQRVLFAKDYSSTNSWRDGSLPVTDTHTIPQGGGQCFRKLMIHVQTTTILYIYGGINFKSSSFFHMLSLCKFLLWINRKGVCITYNSKLPIIPYPITL